VDTDIIKDIPKPTIISTLKDGMLKMLEKKAPSLVIDINKRRNTVLHLTT
jgi:hypothetical protein